MKASVTNAKAYGSDRYLPVWTGITGTKMQIMGFNIERFNDGKWRLTIRTNTHKREIIDLPSLSEVFKHICARQRIQGEPDQGGLQ